MKVYLSGPITGCPGFRRTFSAHRKALMAEGHVVLDPSRHPDGLTYAEYMDIDMAMIRACDAVARMAGWIDSGGCRAEVAYAECLGKTFIELPLFYLKRSVVQRHRKGVADA
jgi:nucleoside 2-deoxyribosyltransferase